MSDKQYITIDGISMELEKGLNPKRACINIPVFCYMPELSIYGACRIISEMCSGCGECVDVCPVQAIYQHDTIFGGEKRTCYMIEESSCIKCKSCIERCRSNAVIEEA